MYLYIYIHASFLIYVYECYSSTIESEMAIALVKFSLSPESDSIINTIIITLFEINKFNDIQAF